MPYAKTSQRRERRDLREKMRSMGLGHRDIAAEFARRYSLRPRAAWREAYGWSLQDTADRINGFRGNTGLDPGGLAGMTASHLSEYETWPGYRPEPSGRRPTPYLLAVLAAVYDCAVTDLIDLADREYLPPADLLILDKYSQSDPRQPHPDRRKAALLPGSTAYAEGPGVGPQVTGSHEVMRDAGGGLTVGALLPPMAVLAQSAHRSGNSATRAWPDTGWPPDGPGRAKVSRLESLPPDQLDELLALLDQQWHALVKTDNLLGPRAALGGVRTYLGVIDALLRTARSATRARVLALGARYAESAAWLCEDSGEVAASRYWIGRSMEYAVEAGDRLMISWTLFRRSQQATADGDAPQVAGLAAAARREAGELTRPMLAAILQQEAHARALEQNEVACHASLDRALELAAPDDLGDASGGHGSFCTPAYLEMQRGTCWLRLGYPSRAVSAYETAIRSLPPAYRRDCGVALSGKAAALAAANDPDQAALTARQALNIAWDCGSGRIMGMVTSVASGLAPHRTMDSVAGLRAALGEFAGA
jgi:tetratricopeptide (TPR) repeat protein